MKTELSLLGRTLELYRYPKLNNEKLQAWDAGDEYLITHIEEQNLNRDQHILVLNDNFGALSCWLSSHHIVTTVSDSFISQQGIHANLAHNHCAEINVIASVDNWPKNVNLIIMQIPRNNRYLTWQLSQIRALYGDTCQVIAVNRAKEIHSSTLKLFERHLGHTTTSLAWKKHRLVFSVGDQPNPPHVDPYTTWQVEEESMTLSNLPNVYSGESLDLGARFFLPHLPSHTKYRDIVDLGCGNGVLSVKLRLLNPEATITSVDESYMAVESAKNNVSLNRLSIEKARFVANNCLDGFSAESQDLVVCNPPFHQQQAITDHIAWQMFCDAKHVLRTGGELLVIGNRHLGYDKKLEKLFGKRQVKLVATNAKFVILQATK
ncbi:methyltransferase [Vibrio nomapromontoriensis]|uniref:methyltransferase n=1 Tax=Vibrio nomapromontoriensis TaxID=2910246 RepID=UPI003D0FD5F1